ncbi:MAG: TlpA family protein disulfide reductase [Actinomycetota bacterium]
MKFLTSPGQDGEKPMEKFVKDFNWPESMTHAVDPDGSLWRHLNVRYRGAWIFVNADGKVLFQSVSHIPEKEVRSRLDALVSN